jgi:hypothetical protein
MVTLDVRDYQRYIFLVLLGGFVDRHHVVFITAVGLRVKFGVLWIKSFTTTSIDTAARRRTLLMFLFVVGTTALF